MDGKDTKRKSRPTQRLYVPPAQRNKNRSSKKNAAININTSNVESIENTSVENELNCVSATMCTNIESNSTNTEEQSIVILLGNLKTRDVEKSIDVDKEEMDRAIVNINRKTRPLIKHVNVGNKDVLHISIDDKEIKQKTNVKKVKGAILHEQVSNWEDLCNEEDEISGEITEQIREYGTSTTGNSQHEEESCDEEEFPRRNSGPNDLDHVIELYDFPSSFRTQDLIQLYSDVNNDVMYVKWCDETHALLVLSTPNQAKRALHIQHTIIQSRSMKEASNIALQVATRVDLKPAMKRPQTNMQTARRLITNHLGTKSRLSKEEHAKEREELRKAKELKRALKQSENDAWDGHPRPSTA